MVSKSRIGGARGEGLSGLEGLLAVVALGVTTEGIRTGTGTERWVERVQTLGAATLKLCAPNDVRTNGAERRLVSRGAAEHRFVEIKHQTCRIVSESFRRFSFLGPQHDAARSALGCRQQMYIDSQ